MSESKKKHIVLLYHYFYPDTVASARYFVQLAQDLLKKNYTVTVLTSNRFRMHPDLRIENDREIWRSINIIRVSRPAWNQNSYILRLLSSFLIMIKWLKEIYFLESTDCFIIGTNPEMSQFLFPFVKIFKKNSQIYYWCFDLFPDAIVADNRSLTLNFFCRKIDPLLKYCYKFCDHIIDLGVAMQRRLTRYGSVISMQTITPWALVEADDIPANMSGKNLFADVSLKILYSGTLAKGHNYTLLVKLARLLKKKKLSNQIIFACQGQRKQELINYVNENDRNISIRDFLPEEELNYHLSSADFIAMSIENGWDGIIFPSKFFGAIAMGKPVLFFGSKSCDMAQWIEKYSLGICMSETSDVESVLEKLLEISNDSAAYQAMSRRCQKTYRDFFSRDRCVEKWDQVLRSYTRQESSP